MQSSRTFFGQIGQQDDFSSLGKATGDSLNGGHGRMINNDGILEINNDRVWIVCYIEQGNEMPCRPKKDGPLDVHILDLTGFPIDHHWFEFNIGLDTSSTIPRMNQCTKGDSRRNGHCQVEKDRHERDNENDSTVRQTAIPQDLKGLPLKGGDNDHEQDSREGGNGEKFDEPRNGNDKEKHEQSTAGGTDAMPGPIHDVDGGLSNHGISSHGPEQTRH
mmetsp:Transcript_17147/g.30997  ORF Transcript_17147/g.30997 Transcript_17147/m.30997 type:complete len:218 (+) Transcript_17147:357-1010(+)